MTFKEFKTFKNKFYISWLLAVFCFFIVVGGVYAETKIVFFPSSQTVEYDETFDVEVRVEDVTNVHAVKTVFTYDSDILEIVSVTEGSFLSSAGSAWFSTTPSPASSASGTLQADQATYGSATASCAGSYGVLYTVRFHAKAYGISSLTFTETSLRDGSNDEIAHTSENGSVTVNEVIAKVKIWLEGPYQSGGSMTTSLNSNGYIPLSSPYSEAPRTVLSIPSGVTDWILVELRNSASGSAIAQQSFFLKSNGNIVDIDGSTTDLPIGGLADGDYYIVIKHRNHLAVMSAAVQSLNGSSPSVYDFTTALTKYYGSDAASVESGVYGMYAGDANGSEGVNATDYLVVKSVIGLNGYYAADCNLSGGVNATDYLVIKPNIGKNSNII